MLHFSPPASILLAASFALSGLTGCALPGVPTHELRVTLSGADAVPPNKSTAVGKGSFWVHTDRTLNGIVETSGIEGTAAYLSMGRPGEVGPVAVQLVRTSSDGPVAMEHTPVSGASWSMPRSARFNEEQYSAFLAGQIYVNVHSARFPLGEIRGQLRP
jgi:hypothetical protein